MTQRESLQRRVFQPKWSAGATVLLMFRESQDIVVRDRYLVYEKVSSKSES
jgi:hypothetical protein